MNIQKQIDHLTALVAKRAAKGFDSTDHIERIEHLKHCLSNDHEYSEAVYAEVGKPVVMCLWCDQVKQ
jgi:hypothetical protein